MKDHYTHATAAHDAVIRGRIDDVGASLGALSEVALPAGAPETWQALHAAMRSAAAGGSEVTDLDGAAQAVAAVSLACGSCHTSVGKGPVFSAPAAPEATMQTHQWATERLWEGLTGPSDSAWDHGGTTLTTTQIWADPPSPRAQALAEALRSAAARATKAASPHDKGEAYATLLSTCATCHAAAGVVFPAPTP